jgi:hypothetical protein
MSARHDFVDTVTEVRLSVVAEAAANLIAQLSECRIYPLQAGDSDEEAGEELRLGTFELRDNISLSEK